MSENRVCHHCADRHIGCHSGCEKYIEEVKQSAKLKTIHRYALAIDAYEIDTILKLARRKKLQYGRGK